MKPTDESLAQVHHPKDSASGGEEPSLISAQLQSLRMYGPATILCAMACVHFVRVQTQDLTPWKGGGFGMFSTVDSGGARALRLKIKSNGREYLCQLPKDKAIAKAMSLAKRLPSKQNLIALGEHLALRRWAPKEEPPGRGSGHYSSRSREVGLQIDEALGLRPALIRPGQSLLVAADTTQPNAGLHLVLPDELTLEVHRLDFDMANREAGFSLLKSATVTGLPPQTLAEKWQCSTQYLMSLQDS